MSRRMLISVKNLTISHLGRSIIDKLTLSVSAGELVALVGANGCGKSTLLNSLHARHRRDEQYFIDNDFVLSGRMNLSTDLSLALLPQNLRAGDQSLLSLPAGSESIRLEHRLSDTFHLDAGHDDPDRLSDGQLQKLALIRTLASAADLYLLDEASNYLDITALTALESSIGELKARGCGFLMVTHDRTLTDNLADRTVYIAPNGVYHTRGGFTQAWSLKTADFDSRCKRATQIKRKIASMQQDMHRKSQWATDKEKSKIGAGREKPVIAKKAKRMAKRARVIGRKAEKEMDKLRATKPFVPKKVDLRFPTYPIKRREVFALDDVSFSYRPATIDQPTRNDAKLLKGVTLSARTTDKLCLMGANGSGKTTLLRLIRQELSPQAGRCSVHPGVNLQYMPQGLAGYFSKDKLLDNFDYCGCDETTVRKFLGAALIRRDKVTEPLSRFSQGELMRAAVVRCLLERAEFLLLDEPTSHLDIESIEVLETMLGSFQGGFLLISHDRTFVENVANRLYLLEDGRLRLV